MEILINELSLSGQFKDENEFLDSFDIVLEFIKFIDELEFTLLKEYSFFQAQVTSNTKLDNFLKLRNDRAKRMKRFLLKLAYNPPYWNETQKHDCSNDKYLLNANDICDTSLAESCERDRVILSFAHSDFLNTNLEIIKNSSFINIYNFIDKSHFLDYLLSISQIGLLNYCQIKFKNSNLNFSLLDDNYGFNILNISQQKEFINTFHSFSNMSWENIVSSDGLQYKRYKGNEFKQQIIYKFRVTQKYRCFGYRQDNEFFVLRFEIDHKISDNG